MAGITLDLDGGALCELQARSTRENKPLGVIVSELLDRALDDESPQNDDLVWVSRPMGVKVDLEDRDALLAALDRA